MVNRERGEVALEVGGQTFVLCAHMENVVELMDVLEAQTLNDLEERLQSVKDGHVDPRPVLRAAQCLCISENADGIGQALRIADLGPAATAIWQAVTHGLTAADDEATDPGNPTTARET